MSLWSKGLFLAIAAVLVAVLVIPASAVDDTAVSSDTESGDSGGGDHITIYEAPDYPTDEETGVLLVQTVTPEGDADLNLLASGVFVIGGVITGILLGSEVFRRWML